MESRPSINKFAYNSFALGTTLSNQIVNMIIYCIFYKHYNTFIMVHLSTD